jgi:hypothetical protein
MVKKATHRKLIAVAIFLALVIGLFNTFLVSVAHATIIHTPLPVSFSWPSWWSGNSSTNQCDASWYNNNNTNNPKVTETLLTTWRGIEACGPRPHDGTPIGGGLTTYDAPETMPNTSLGTSASQYMWECTELAARYLEVAFGIPSQVANGGAFATNYYNAFSSLFQHYTNDGTQVYPQEGDVISMSSSDPNGHVGIVKQLSVSGTPGTATITIMDQNGSDSESPAGTFQLSVVNYVVQASGGYSNFDWIHPKLWNDISPVGTTTDIIYGMSASSTSSIWAAGYEQPSGSNPIPVTYFNNGSGGSGVNPNIKLVTFTTIILVSKPFRIAHLPG